MFSISGQLCMLALISCILVWKLDRTKNPEYWLLINFRYVDWLSVRALDIKYFSKY